MTEEEKNYLIELELRVSACESAIISGLNVLNEIVTLIRDHAEQPHTLSQELDKLLNPVPVEVTLE